MKTNKKIQCDFYLWKLFKRNGVFYADGRGNRGKVGKHSLNTRDKEEALRNLKQLDCYIAAQNGNQEAIKISASRSATDIDIAAGIKLYLDSVEQRQQIENRSPKTLARYRAVLDKFQEYLKAHSKVSTWAAVSDSLLKAYAAWLAREIGQREFEKLKHRRIRGPYGQKTLNFEIDTIKQVAKMLADEKCFSPQNKLKYSISAPAVSDRECYSLDEVSEILCVTEEDESLHEMHDIALTLSKTGVRIGELQVMRWTDIETDGDKTWIRLCNDETPDGKRRRTKNGRDRLVPLCKEIMARLATYERHPDGYIFHGPRGGRLKPDTIRNILKRDVLPRVEANLRKRGIDSRATRGCLHSFRHYFCSQCVKQRMPPQVIEKIMGHRDSSMIKHYLHLHDNDVHEMLEGIDL